MNSPLLLTKFHIPLLGSALVKRNRLIEQLNQGIGSKLILISAPAGFGKTTLLSEWSHQAVMPVGWLSLDEADNDPHDSGLTLLLPYNSFIAKLENLLSPCSAQRNPPRSSLA